MARSAAQPVEQMSSRLACFVELSGPIDLTRVRPRSWPDSRCAAGQFANAFTAAIGCTADEFENDPNVRQRVRDASPLFLVSRDDPPALVVARGAKTWRYCGIHPCRR